MKALAWLGAFAIGVVGASVAEFATEFFGSLQWWIIPATMRVSSMALGLWTVLLAAYPAWCVLRRKPIAKNPFQLLGASLACAGGLVGIGVVITSLSQAWSRRQVPPQVEPVYVALFLLACGSMLLGQYLYLDTKAEQEPDPLYELAGGAYVPPFWFVRLPSLVRSLLVLFTLPGIWLGICSYLLVPLVWVTNIVTGHRYGHRFGMRAAQLARTPLLFLPWLILEMPSWSWWGFWWIAAYLVLRQFNGAADQERRVTKTWQELDDLLQRRAPSIATPEVGARMWVSEAEGEWVTSSHPAAKNYYHKSDLQWQRLGAGNRVWFKTEEELLSEYPSRVRARS